MFKQTSGEPGYNNADIKIRGISTIGNANALVIIDGIERKGGRGRATWALIVPLNENVTGWIRIPTTGGHISTEFEPAQVCSQL